MKDIKGIPYIANVKGDERQVVIILHGFDSSKDSPTAKMMLEELPKAGIGAIAFDMPGHGDNPVPREDLRVSGCMLALEAIEELVGELAPQAEISYFGSSFGAYIVLNALALRPELERKAFLRSAAINMPYLDFEEYEEAPAEFITEMQEAFDLMWNFGHSKSSFKMIHGTLDEDIAYQVAEFFSQKFGIELITIENGDHRLSGEGMPERVLKEALDFFLA